MSWPDPIRYIFCSRTARSQRLRKYKS
uniref:Uncharacterized protein n=1 Tax=Arundo donax TaxID=35708 RepID=A0A0A9E5G8_ARUDO